MKKSYLISSLAVLASGLVALAVGLIVPYLQLQNLQETSVGIIGGTNLHTYRQMLFSKNEGMYLFLALFGGAMVLSGGFSLLFSKTVQK